MAYDRQSRGTIYVTSLPFSLSLLLLYSFYGHISPIQQTGVWCELQLNPTSPSMQGTFGALHPDF